MPTQLSPPVVIQTICLFTTAIGNSTGHLNGALNPTDHLEQAAKYLLNNLLDQQGFKTSPVMDGCMIS